MPQPQLSPQEQRKIIEEGRGAIAALGEELSRLLGPQRSPRAEMMALLRHSADDGGIPARCRARSCQRTGRCHAEDFCDNGPPRWRYWPVELAARLLAQFEAIEFAWLPDSARRRELRDHFDKGRAEPD